MDFPSSASVASTSIPNITDTAYQPITDHHHHQHRHRCNADSASDGYDSDSASMREQKGMREVDAETLISPILSRKHSRVLYDAAGSYSPPRSVTASEDEVDETEGGVRKIQQHRHTLSSPLPPQKSHYRHHILPQKKPLQKNTLNFSLPSFSLPRNVSFPSFSSSSPSAVEAMTERYKRARAKTIQPGALMQRERERERGSSFFGKPVSRLAPPPPTPTVRRSSSVSSLTRLSLSRVATGGSTTSSLGDDAKFLHIHTQTNSRLKAIKDNLLAGLPAMPPVSHLQQHLANLNPFIDTGETPPPPFLPPKSAGLEALDTVTGDVVVLGGYRGSILRDTAAGRRVWIPLKVGFNLRKIDLEVGLDPEDEERAPEKIRPEGMLKSISAVDISRRLFRRLRANADAHGRRVHDYGYDWRLSPTLLARQLISFLEALPCNQPGSERKGAMVIAHSLGGLIVRYAINHRPELFSGVVFAGTPMNCINILGPLKNGDSVLFNSRVFTAQVSFTLRSSYAFLPENGHCFIDKHSGKHLPVDFFNVKTWREYGLSPCVSDLPTPPQSLPSTAPLSSRLTNASSAVLQTLKKEKEREKDVEIAPYSPPPPFSTENPTIPKSRAIPYLERTLAETISFRRELYYKPALEGRYPPMAVLYSKTTPTVRGAKVDGREGIKRADVYEDLVFGAGDGVCLAKAAMLPRGYRCAWKEEVDRGHVSLLGELEGVGRCVGALVKERGW